MHSYGSFHIMAHFPIGHSVRGYREGNTYFTDAVHSCGIGLFWIPDSFCWIILVYVTCMCSFSGIICVFVWIFSFQGVEFHKSAHPWLQIGGLSTFGFRPAFTGQQSTTDPIDVTRSTFTVAIHGKFAVDLLMSMVCESSFLNTNNWSTTAEYPTFWSTTSRPRAASALDSAWILTSNCWFCCMWYSLFMNCSVFCCSSCYCDVMSCDCVGNVQLLCW